MPVGGGPLAAAGDAPRRAPRVALLTCRELPEPDVDEALTVTALEAAGCDVTLLAWNAPSASPAEFDLCVLRSTWDYFLHVPEFLAFLEHAAAVTQLLNPLEVVRWNLHKRYLEALEAAGLPVVPTAWFERGGDARLEAAHERGWYDLVIKPCVSAASFDTRRFRAHEQAEAAQFLARLVSQRDAMVQPYVPTVERGGERALVWIDGQLTHAIAKQPRFAHEDERVSGALTPSAAERDFVARTLALLPAALAEQLLYARVDVFDDGDGRPVLSELELIEPSLFLEQHPPALAAFVDGIRRRLP